MMEKNVQVAVRVRPMNEREKALQRPSVVSALPKTHQISVKKKTYTFDRVFGQYATQKDVFKGVVQSAADEALAGFNCTVFAYGQTGTGKTHTIQGNLKANHEDSGNKERVLGAFDMCPGRRIVMFSRQTLCN
ncbi:Aste57867_4988 [Aphanomyces stellatus]|uniref:Aste57867_4988 protein n=1 Tax=Aphanomyces stellatus TaxID=120398 RepID=A0A485KDX6_9STRA|nr:hypothetical protein As57867_004975 [Aphanomyces stellatus]VFT82074.1 Aste57867_4988 [Aphanomyces stellatus]